VSLGLAGQYVVTPWMSVMAEYIPVLGSRSDGTSDALSMGIDLETGGHIFQMYFTSTQWIAPQYAVSKSREQFFDGDFGFGFTLHRVF